MDRYVIVIFFFRLKAATQDSESVRRKQTDWERQVGELQGRCASLEEEKFEALSRLHNSIQLAEEASLQREQVTLQINTAQAQFKSSSIRTSLHNLKWFWSVYNMLL